jgi:transposase
VISDIMGFSGRRMIEAMIDGLRNPWKLAELAHNRIKAPPQSLDRWAHSLQAPL